MKKISILKICALLAALIFVYLMFTVDKMMIWLAFAAVLLVLPRENRSRLSSQWFYTAFGLLCFGYFSGTAMWGGLGLIVAAVSFSPLLDSKQK